MYFGLSGLVLSIMERELSFRDGINSHEVERIYILSVVFVMSVLMAFTIILRHLTEIKFQKD